MHKTSKNAIYGMLLASTVLATQCATAEVGVGVRGGTLGYGLDFDVGMTEKLNLRLAYNYFNYHRTIDDTDVSYDGTLKISSFSGFLDWHAFGGGFRVSLGAVGSGPKIDVVGTPTSGSYEIDNHTYTAAEVGSLRGQLKTGNAVAPYIGIGYGNIVSEKHRVTFLFDLGAIYGGTPDVSLNVVCGAAIANTPRCTQLQNDVQVEVQDMKDNAKSVEWYPVLNIGIGIRF